MIDARGSCRENRRHTAVPVQHERREPDRDGTLAGRENRQVHAAEAVFRRRPHEVRLEIDDAGERRTPESGLDPPSPGVSVDPCCATLGVGDVAGPRAGDVEERRGRGSESAHT